MFSNGSGAEQLADLATKQYEMQERLLVDAMDSKLERLLAAVSK